MLQWLRDRMISKKELLESGVVFKKAEYPLIAAAECNFSYIVGALLATGMNPHKVAPKGVFNDKSQISAISIAAIRRSIKSLRLLLQYAHKEDVN